MILQEQHESRRRQVATGPSARYALAVRRRFTLIDEALFQAAAQLGRGIFRIVGVIALGLAGQQHMQRMMAVIIPLGIECRWHQVGRIVLMFHYQVDAAVGCDPCADVAGQLG